MSGSYDDGQTDKTIEIAKNLKKIGMDVKTFMEMTGLNRQDVEKIYKSCIIGGRWLLLLLGRKIK